MLQLQALNARAAAHLPRPDPSHPAFAIAVDRAIAQLRARRRAIGLAGGGWTGTFARLDARLRTDRPERMDDPTLPEDERVRMLHDLHLHNRIVGTYRRFVTSLAPWIRRIAERKRRPARLLELASGSGAFTLELARRARSLGLAVEVTGSDVVEAYVAQARAEAERLRIGVDFRVLDALSLDGLEPGAYDLVFLGQAAHHFSPGQLACVVRAARRVATTAFVAVDGRRSLAVFAVLAVTNTVLPRLRHDSFVSARKFYSEPELAWVARAAAPDAHVEVGPSHPGYSVLAVSWA